ncbi:hypothetical protein PYW08_015170 [Mythimna loreyi]|uniref:Uncharacterized protein n=2 Tax=Mythimna loreyi TaxID=667449 RepID=A0ACC2QNU4_9NEOP|nr:hypothetical protein PYW08_006174 [Mythimna loreyi]KAJ8726773.1 hypothetical protein PYW08_015170 [Mythimna loreyi]
MPNIFFHLLQIDNARIVTGVKCSCVYNQSGKCKHVAALICYINNKVSYSKTSSEQQWGKPSIRQFVDCKYSKGRYFQEMFGSVSKTESCGVCNMCGSSFYQASISS